MFLPNGFVTGKMRHNEEMDSQLAQGHQREVKGKYLRPGLEICSLIPFDDHRYAIHPQALLRAGCATRSVFNRVRIICSYIVTRISIKHWWFSNRRIWQIHANLTGTTNPDRVELRVFLKKVCPILSRVLKLA